MQPAFNILNKMHKQHWVWRIWLSTNDQVPQFELTLPTIQILFFFIRNQENWNVQIPSFSASILLSLKSTWILLNLYWLMHSSYCHHTEDKNVKEHGKKGHSSWMKQYQDSLLFCLACKSVQNSEPDSAACIHVSGGDGYVSDRNTILNKPAVGSE